MDIEGKVTNRNGNAQPEGLGVFIRPWGFYRNLYVSPTAKVKILHIYPDQKLSLQYHKNRFENWIIQKGEVVVTLQSIGRSIERQHVGTVGGYFDIPPYLIHRISNESDQDAEVLEMQWGAEIDELDIIRLDDIYNRS